MTDQQLEARFKAMEDRFEVRVEHLIRFMAQEFEAVRQELRRELGALERRVGFLGEVTANIQSQLGALTRQDGTREAEMGQMRGAQAGQQRAIEDLDRRLRRLEEKNGPGQKS